jgi:hypothetical protein
VRIHIYLADKVEWVYVFEDKVESVEVGDFNDYNINSYILILARTFRPRTRGYLNNNQISRFTPGNRNRYNYNNNNNRGRRNNNNNNNNNFNR